MAIDHKNIPDAELHDPKGFSSATNNTVLSKSSAGALEWSVVDTDNIAIDAVTNAKIATNAVNSDSISNGSVIESKLASNSVTNSKIVNSSVTTAKIANDSVTNDELQSPSAGTSHLVLRVQEIAKSANGESYPNPEEHRYFSPEQHMGFTCLVSGTITVSAEHRRSNSNGLVYLRIIKNGSQVVEWNTNSFNFVTQTYDLSVNVGDCVIFQQREDTESNAQWQHLRVYSNNPTFAAA